MPKYRVTFRKSPYAPNGEVMIIEANSEQAARDRARSEWMSRHRYYGSSRPGHKNEQRARAGYSRGSKPIDVSPLADSRSGHDKSAGMPSVGKVTED